MWFLDFVTVFKESYNCQTSHNLGRNQLPKPLLLPLEENYGYTANISAVKITVFRRVPFPAVIPLYYLHLITALSTVEKCKHRFTVVYYKIYTFTW